MLCLTLSEEDIKEIGLPAVSSSTPPCERKMEALLLKAKGLPHHQIASCVGVCENTVRSYFQQYQIGGIEALKRLEIRRPTSELEAHQDTIEAYFREHPATTIPQAVKRIEELTGVKRSPTQVGIFLKKLGLKRLKTSAIPASAMSSSKRALKKRTGAASRASQSRSAKHLFRRCGPFCPWCLPGLVMVFCSRGRARSQWQATLECPGSAACHHPPAHYRDQ